MFEDKKWDNTFKKRLDGQYEEKKWPYSELYQDDTQAFTELCEGQ